MRWSLLLLVACHREPVKVDAATLPSGSPAASASPDRDALLRTYFKHFSEKSDFQFLRTYWSAATVENEIEKQKKFFADKQYVQLAPDRFSTHGAITSVVVEMMWRAKPPAAWGSDFELVRHDAIVHVDITFDADFDIVSQVETSMETHPMKTSGTCTDTCIPPGNAYEQPVHCKPTLAPKATYGPKHVVEDLGEAIDVGGNAFGTWTMRKVRADNQELWMLEINPVGNPDGRSGQDHCLTR